MRSDAALLAWTVAAAPLAGIAWYLAGTPGAVILAAVIPALVCAGVLACIARAAHVRLRPSVILFSLAWGATVAALASAPVNDLLQARFGNGWWLAVLGAPLVEETAKAGVLLALVQVWGTELHGVRSGIVLGALVGLGFCLAENVQYLLIAAVQGGIPGLVRAGWVRGLVEGGVHPVCTACTGAGLGRDRAVPGGRAGLVGFGVAVVQHALWNGLGSRTVTTLLCNGMGQGGACRGDPGFLRLAVAVPLVVIAALGPGVVALAVLARRDA